MHSSEWLPMRQVGGGRSRTICDTSIFPVSRFCVFGRRLLQLDGSVRFVFGRLLGRYIDCAFVIGACEREACQKTDSSSSRCGEETRTFAPFRRGCHV
jgi:hypothetical protein